MFVRSVSFRRLHQVQSHFEEVRWEHTAQVVVYALIEIIFTHEQRQKKLQRYSCAYSLLKIKWLTMPIECLLS